MNIFYSGLKNVFNSYFISLRLCDRSTLIHFFVFRFRFSVGNFMFINLSKQSHLSDLRSNKILTLSLKMFAQLDHLYFEKNNPRKKSLSHVLIHENTIFLN